MADGRAHITSQGVSWGVLGLLAGIAVPLIVGAIQLGGIQQQVRVNTQRLDKLEQYREESVKADAEIQAEVRLMRGK